MSITFRTIEKKILDDKTLNDDEEQFLAGKVNDYWEQHPDATYRHARWKKIMAWVAGHQYMDYHRTKQELLPIPRDKQRRIVFNRLRPFVRTMLGKVCQVQPQMGIVPSTEEYEDVRAAETGDRVVDFLAKKVRFDYERRMFFLWLILLNRAYMRVFWNRDDHGILDMQPETDEEGKPIEGGDIVAIKADGEVGIETVPPFNCRPDPLFFDRKKWRWFIYGEYADAEALEEEYELEDGALTTESDSTLDDPFALAAHGDRDFALMQVSHNEDVTGRKIVRKEFWTPKFYVILAGKTVLEYGPNPYEEIPYYTHEERLIPTESYEKGIVFNDSIVKDQIPVQREYNRFVSLMSLSLERASKIKIMSPFDSLVNKKQIFDDGGMVIVDYNKHMGEPYQLKLDTLPTFAMPFKQDMEREMESISSVHEASFGRLPNRASHASGALVNLLIEQDDIVLDPMIRDVDEVFGQVWNLALRMVQSQYIEPRLIRVVGRGQLDGVFNFMGADLQGNTDVHVTTQTGMPKSRALRVEWIMKLHEAGLIPDKKTVLELLEFGQGRKVFEDQLLHERYASRENLKIEKNPIVQIAEVQVNDIDDDVTHLKVHMRDRLSPKYDQYTAEQKAVLDYQIKTHKERLQQLQQPQASPKAAGPGPEPGMMPGQGPAGLIPNESQMAAPGMEQLMAASGDGQPPMVG